MRRPMRFLLKVFASLLLVFTIAGVAYEQLGRRRDRKRFSQIGRSVDIGGRSLNIHCIGEGSPTVVLEGAVGYRWTPIQREVATFTRACWYDRAGHGWSDPGPSPRTSAPVASDLHALLKATAVPPPYVLVGASGAGFPVRVFAGRHLNEVAGVVLVDAVHEDQYQREPRSSWGWANRLPAPVRSALYTVTPVTGEVGLIRLMLRSLSIPHDVRNYGCGATPVCVACDRLALSGVVVVAAAGNRGWSEQEIGFGSFVFCSITDPGNARHVITVGSTHRANPHTYGVSYFSSRGPTGDGRIKPDLVAPGEKIRGPIRGNADDRLDGTSMASPYVSGAAAMLMTRNRELIGNALRVKEILCRSATDLGREKYFQGNGLVDVLRALQST